MSADRLVRVRRTGALALVTALTACSWFTDFKDQPKYDPWKSADTVAMRANPQSSVPVYGTFAPGYAVSRTALPGTIDSMASIANPIAPDARSLLNGRKYYTINCAVCHGYEGKGDGPVVAKGFPGIPLVGPASPAPGRTDGYIWGMIRNGRGLMPTYNRIEEYDRWDVVNYVRGLQGRYAVAIGPVGLPGETGDKVPGFSQSGPTRPSPYYDRVGSQAGPWPTGMGINVKPGAESPVNAPTDTGAARRAAPPNAARRALLRRTPRPRALLHVPPLPPLRRPEAHDESASRTCALARGARRDVQQAAAEASAHVVDRARRHRLDRVRRRCAHGPRSCVGRVPLQLAVLRVALVGGRRVRRGAAHRDHALVSPHRATARGLRRVPARRLRPAAGRAVSSGRGTSSHGRTERPPVAEKVVWYNAFFLSTRAIVSFGVITLLSLWYIYTSVRLDVGLLPEWGSKWAAGLRARMRAGFGEERRELHSTHSLQGKLAVILALCFGYGWSLLAFDLSMGLSLHFQSTLYGWWFFMGAWLTSLTLFTLLVMAWRRYLGAQAFIGENHFHDLGKLCFAFTAFWGYLTFGQYLVIWYGNLGEETHWPRLRLIQPWVWTTVAAATMVFLIPFFGLLSRAAKVYRPTLVLFTVISFVGMYLVRYLEVYPSLFATPASMPFGFWEIGVTLGYVGLWGHCYLAFMNAFPRVRAVLMTSPYRDEVQVPVNSETMEPLPAHE